MASPKSPKVGECTFDELLKRSKKSYACDKAVKIEDGKKIIKHIEHCIGELEKSTGETVTKFYIGKTYAHQEGTAIDPEDKSTYKKGGIASRWGNHKHEEYGRDGMVVLTIVTKDAVPQDQEEKLEDHTLGLEKELIEHFKSSPRYKDSIANKSSKKGKSTEEPSAGYALYMAYSLGKQSDENSGEDQIRQGVQKLDLT